MNHKAFIIVSCAFSSHGDGNPLRVYCIPALRRCFFVFVVAALTISLLNASPDKWRIVSYSLGEGLSQISVNSIIQDSDGFLWIGTQDGLNRFDGYGFVVYRHQPSDPHSLSNSYIGSIIQDKEGNIWVGTQDGLNRLDKSSNTFSVFRHQPGDPGSLSNNNIHYVYQDRTGIIWLKTEDGIDGFDPETGVFRHFRHYNDVFNYISGSNYFSIYEDRDNRLWIGSKDGLLLFDRDREEFERYWHDPRDPNSLSNDKIKSIFETSGGHFLVGTENGLNVFDRESGIFSSFYFDRAGPVHSRKNAINAIFEDSRGLIWIGTDAGLFNFTPETGMINAFSEKSLANRALVEAEISSIIEDRSDNIWLGTLGGLHMLDSKSKFNTYRIHDFMPDAPPAASYIASIYPANDEEIWLGTWGAGLFILNRRTGNIRHYSSNSRQISNRISNDFVHVIFADSRGRIILGTRNGMDIFTGGWRSFVPFCFSADRDECLIFNSNRIYCIYEDSQQALWIGTRYGLHTIKEEILTSYYYDPHDSTSIPSNQVHDITECSEGLIWVATSGGLGRFDRETGMFDNYRKDPDLGNLSLSNNELTCLHKDSNGGLWIGSVAGLNRFFSNNESFMVFSEIEGLPNNLINSILEDGSGNLWLSTNRGLARLDPATLEITAYDVADGLQSWEFNLGARYKSEYGELFFGGVGGVDAFYPDSLKLNKTIPSVVITSFEVISPRGNRFINLGDAEEIILQPHENSFSIEFAALDFTRPEKNRYTYILEGLGENWIYSGKRRLANFSSIPSGTYVFRVRGSNNDNVWNEEGLSLKISVITPWTRSVYLYFLYAILASSSVYLLIIYNTRRLRTANQNLKEKELTSVEITRQKEELTMKNRNITDSIHYAKRIQLAMMPTSSHLQRLFPESFVYYKPKDIVSGDFYWVNERNDKVYFGVVDCTGHGVPGAFMSIIGLELLRNIINVKGIERPAEILNQLNEDFSYIFDSDNDKHFTFRDGMDIGFCVINRKTALLEYAGAFSTLYLLRNRSIIEVKGNRFSVGLMEDLIDEPFKNHCIRLAKNDMIYLFSDGYPDQFGGDQGKKFKYRRFRYLLLNIHLLPAGEQEKLLHQSMMQWMGDYEQVDDILIIGVRPGIGH